MADIRLKPLAPAESVAYFRDKGYRVGFDYRDVEREEHQASFTVAKAMQVDLLAEIRAAVDAAIADGTTFATFQDALMPRLAARGWWGKQVMTDPVTGEDKVVQLGSPRRLQVIYGTNLATAYSEGQWERIQRNKRIFPFLEYVRSASANPRDSHLAYAGLVLPVDAPFWQAHMPIKEYGCKCSVIQHTARTLARSGLSVGEAPAEVMRQVTNQRTGEVMEVPSGVHPSFHYPPGGRAASLGKLLMDKAEGVNAALASRMLAGQQSQSAWLPLVQSEFEQFVGRYEAGERRSLGTRRVVGVLSPTVVGALQALGQAPASAGISVQVSALSKLIGRNRGDDRQALNPNVQALGALPAMLAEAESVWWDAADGGALVLLVNSPNDVRQLKVVVRLNFAEKLTVTNAVRSVLYIDRRKLQTKGWVRLDK